METGETESTERMGADATYGTDAGLETGAPGLVTAADDDVGDGLNGKARMRKRGRGAKAVETAESRFARVSTLLKQG